MERNFRWKVLRFTGVGILLAMFVCAQIQDGEPAGNSGEEPAVQEDIAEGGNPHEYFLPEGYAKIPQMCVEEGGVYVTGVVLVHKGMPYALTEEEYLFLRSHAENAGDTLIDELLAKRKGRGGK